MLGLRGVVHVVGGPDVLHGRVPAKAGRACSPAPSPCRGPGRRLRRLRVPRPTLPLPLRQLPAIAPATSHAVGARAAAPKYPKAPPTPSAATATSPSSAATAACLSSMRMARSLGRGASTGSGRTSSGRTSLCRARAVPRARALAVAQPWALPWAWRCFGLGSWRGNCLGRSLGHTSCLGRWPRALPWVQPWAPSWALWEISPSWDGRGSPLHTPAPRSSIIFFSLPGRRSFFCSSAGAARAAWACFYYPGACL